MAQKKYLDHGAYFPAEVSFTASWANGSSNMTIVSLDQGSGPIMVGMPLVHPNLADLVYVSAITSGNGGPGNIVMSQQSSQSSGGQVNIKGVGGCNIKEPIWGEAQDGDGLGSNKAKSAVTSIDFTGATAVVGARLYIAGAELVCASPGTSANQFAPSNNNILVANLVTAINRAANTVTVAQAASGWETPKVQDAVFARQDPNNGNILQLMTRAGSAMYNANPLFSVTYSTTGWTGLSGGPFMFTGGLSGCWGFFMTPAVTSFGSNIAVSGYGVFSNTPPFAGVIQAGDEIILRAHRRYFDSTCYSLNAASAAVTPPWSGTEALPIFVRNDTGVIWPEDASNGVEPQFEFKCRPTTDAHSINFYQSANCHVHFKGTKYPSGRNGIAFSCVATFSPTGPRMRLRVGHHGGFENFDLIGWDRGLVAVYASSGGASYSGRSYLRACRISWPRQFSNSALFIAEGSGSEQSIDIEDCDFELRDADAAQIGVLSLFPASTNEQRFYFRGCRFKGFRAGSTLVTSVGASTTSYSAVSYFLNNSFGNVSINSAFKDYVRNKFGYSSGSMGVYITSMYGKQELSLDNPLGWVSWNPAVEPPCLNARLMDNTAWSYRIVPSRQLNNLTMNNPLEVPMFSKLMTSATGRKTVTANFLMEKNMRWRRNAVSISVMYIDAAGAIRTENSFDPTDTRALPNLNESNIWIRPLGGSAMTLDPADGVSRVAFNDSGINLLFDQTAVSLTTRHPVKTGTEVGMIFRVHLGSTYDVDQLFLDPDAQLLEAE